MKRTDVIGIRDLLRCTCLLAVSLPVIFPFANPVFSQSAPGFTNQGIGNEANVTLALANQIITAGQTTSSTLPNSGQPQNTNGGLSDGYIAVYKYLFINTLI